MLVRKRMFDMPIMIKAGGELYIPCRVCSADESHYETSQTDIPHVSVGPKSLARKYLKMLVGEMDFHIDGFPVERVNLLYPDGELDVTVADVLGPEFDFLVTPEKIDVETPDNCKRFSYRKPNIILDGKRMPKNAKIREIFTPDTRALTLAYLLTPNAKAPVGEVSDYSVVHGWYEIEKQNKVEEITARLTARMDGVKEIEGADLFTYRVLLAIAEYDCEGFDDIIDTLLDDKYDCSCELGEDHTMDSDIDDAIISLEHAGLVEFSEEEDEYSIKPDRLKEEVQADEVPEADPNQGKLDL